MDQMALVEGEKSDFRKALRLDMARGQINQCMGWREENNFQISRKSCMNL